MKTLLTFLRRIPAFLEHCNDLSDIADIWRYGMDAAQAKIDRANAEHSARKVSAIRDEIRRSDDRLRKFIQITTALNASPNNRVFLPDFEPEFSRSEGPVGVGDVSIVEIRGTRLRYETVVDEDAHRRAKEMSEADKFRYSQHLADVLAQKICKELFRS